MQLDEGETGILSQLHPSDAYQYKADILVGHRFKRLHGYYYKDLVTGDTHFFIGEEGYPKFEPKDD